MRLAFAGSTQVNEFGTIETPIVLTNTLAVGTAVDAVVRYTLAQAGNEQVRSVNALVGETNDGGLSDIRGLHVTRQHVLDAIAHAAEGAVTEGAVGAGTGTVNFRMEGRHRAASRRVPGGYTVGVLTQTNYGGNLTIAGVPIFRALQPPPNRTTAPRAAGPSPGDGSCMLVVATDAPLDSRDLGRLAARAVFGLARTGSSYSNGSGDFAIAFSTSMEMRSRFGETAPHARQILPTDAVSPLFEAALEATEEAVYNALFKATTVTSRCGTAEAIPIERVRALLPKPTQSPTAAVFARILSRAGMCRGVGCRPEEPACCRPCVDPAWWSPHSSSVPVLEACRAHLTGAESRYS